jgi:hypothetical protein
MWDFMTFPFHVSMVSEVDMRTSAAAGV